MHCAVCMQVSPPFHTFCVLFEFIMMQRFFGSFLIVFGILSVCLLSVPLSFAQTEEEQDNSVTVDGDVTVKSPEAPADTGESASADAETEVPAADNPVSAQVDSLNKEQASELSAGAYAVRVRDLESRIGRLKEDIFRSKSRLALLSESILHGLVAGSRLRIIHEDKMSSSFRLVRVVYGIDGNPVMTKSDTEGVFNADLTEVYIGGLVPGEHTITVDLEYRGHGYGVFSYTQGYLFRVRSSYSFSVAEGETINIRVIGYEKSGPTVPMQDRPAIRFGKKIAKEVEKKTEDAEAKSS